MKIEEFLEVYTPQEVDKIEYKRKEDANVQRNVLLGKYAGNIVNEKTRGRIDISPEKAVRLIKEAIGSSKYTQCIGVTRLSPKKMLVNSKSPKRERAKISITEDA